MPRKYEISGYQEHKKWHRPQATRNRSQEARKESIVSKIQEKKL